MSYIALYRKWRPRDFNELVGQEHISKTLQNALREKRISHAYLLSGPRGTGKTTTAKIIAKAVNCREPIGGEPCNQCDSCVQINSGHAMDVLEIDGASNRGIDEIRDLRDKVNLSPAHSKFKVYIIDEVHMLTNEAFNALLKTLEEPPGHVIFILATTELQKIPATILSRCQRFDFRRIAANTIKARLEEICIKSEITYEEEALDLLARMAKGGLRDALGLLDQCLSAEHSQITLAGIEETLGISSVDPIADLVDAMLAKKLDVLLEITDQLVIGGKDIRQVTGQLLNYLRDLLVFITCGATTLSELGKISVSYYEKQKGYPIDDIHRAVASMYQAENEMRWSNEPRLTLELAYFRFLFLPSSPPEEVDERLCKLEKEMENIQKIRKQRVPLEEVAVRNVNTPKRDSPKKVEINQAKESEKPEKAAVTLEEITNVWDRVLEYVKKNKITTHAFLMEGKPTDYTGNCLTIVFAKNHSFHKEKIEQPENREIVEEALAYCLKSRLTLRCSCEEEQPEIELKPKGESKVVEEAKKMFGGSVIDLKE